MIFKTVLAFCVGWGALYGVQHYWLAAVTTQVTEISGQQFLPPAPTAPAFEIDPEKMRKLSNPPIDIDTKKYERLAIESMVRQVEQQNRAALDKAALPPRMPGLPYH